MRVLVTGGTGLLGNNVIRRCLEMGHQVVALSRDAHSPALTGLPIDIVRGDLSDPMPLEKATDGIDALIHCAAHIHIGWSQLEEALRVNREGTRYLVDLALARGIRFLHVSTVNTLAVPAKKSIADETTPGDGQIPSTYVISKRAAEEIVQEGIQKGLNATILHPGFMLGPWDWKPSSGRMIIAIAKSLWVPVTPIGGCSVCDVRDVTEGVLATLERGIAGRHYILGGYNLKYFDLWCRIATLVGRPKPIFTPRIHWRILGGLFGDLSARIRGYEADFNSASIRTSAQFHWYSSDRAKSELGYRLRPIDETLRDAVDWLRSRGWIASRT